MSTIKVVVKKSHITNGNRSSMTSCPIALALKAKLHRRVSVGGDDVTIFRNGRGRTISLPQTARNFVNTFDESGADAVKPFRFTLGVETETV